MGDHAAAGARPVKILGCRLTMGIFSPRHKKIAPERPLSAIESEARSAIEAATFAPRHADDDGPRVVVVSQSLGGSFIYSRADAETRIARAFPELTQDGIARARRHLESRALGALKPADMRSRREQNWIRGWRHDAAPFGG